MKKFSLLLALALLSAGASAQFLVPVGQGTVVNTTSSYPAPYGQFYWGAKHQFIYLASELTAAGIQAGPINSLAFDVATPSAQAMTGFTISAGLTTTTAATAWITTGLTVVYTNPSLVNTAGWNTHTFNAPIIWDGVSNLLIETCFNNGSYTTNSIVNQSTTGFVSAIYYRADIATVCSGVPTVTTASQRPNTLFDVGVITTPVFQTNQTKLALKVNNVSGTAYVPTVVNQNVYACSPPQPATGTVKLDTTLLGNNWDIAVSPVGLLPAVLTLPDGQLININIASPFSFINGGFASAFPALFGATSLNLTFNYGFSGQTDFSMQSVAFDATAASGLRVSQATEYHCNALAAAPFVAGPNADTVGTLVNFTASPACYVPSVPFYGVNYTQFYVQSNGRVTFSTSNTSAIPTAAAALTSPPSVGFWTDLNPALAGPAGLGTVNVTNPAPGLVSVNYTNIPYAGEALTANTYQITFDAVTGVISLTGLTGIMPNPQTVLGTGDAQWLGICRGSLGSTNPAAPTPFTVGGAGSPSTATEAMYSFYTQVAGGAGRAPALVAGVGSILFIPSTLQPGNYDWAAF